MKITLYMKIILMSVVIVFSLTLTGLSAIATSEAETVAKTGHRP